MSNGSPSFNPTGTRYKRVRVWHKYHDGSKTYSKHSPQMKGLLRVMGQYIEADYIVRFETYWEDNIEWANMECLPPLLEGIDE